MKKQNNFASAQNEMKKLNTNSNKVFTFFEASTSLFIFFQINNLFKQFINAFLKNIWIQARF